MNNIPDRIGQIWVCKGELFLVIGECIKNVGDHPYHTVTWLFTYSNTPSSIVYEIKEWGKNETDCFYRII